MDFKIFKSYYQLTKPGIIYGNAMAAVAGFLLASKGQVNFLLLLEMLVGTSLVIGSGCVFNNYIDRDIDKKMERTKKRGTASGEVGGKSALIFASILGVLGFLILFLFTNLLTVLVGILGIVFYVVIYGVTKRQGTYGTLVGSIAGATPPLAGYTAVTGRLDAGAILVFLVLVIWQMPHFYAIAIYRLKDYSAAGIPVLPAVKGILKTKINILFYVIFFIIATALLYFLGYTSPFYFVIITLSGLVWLALSIKGFAEKNTEKWARKMFFFSLIILMVFCVLISVNPIAKV
jgi:heme o synthase